MELPKKAESRQEAYPTDPLRNRLDSSHSIEMNTSKGLERPATARSRVGIESGRENLWACGCNPLRGTLDVVKAIILLIILATAPVRCHEAEYATPIS